MKAEEAISQFSFVPDTSVRVIQDIPAVYGCFVSDNDKLYLNYQINLTMEDTENPYAIQKMIAEFRIDNNSISYIGVMPGEVSENGFFPCGRNSLTEEEIKDKVFEYVEENNFGYDCYRYGNVETFRFYDNYDGYIATWLWLYIDVENGYITERIF